MKKYPVNYDEFDDLRDKGYAVIQFTDHHFRVSKYGREISLDVFPTTRSYLIRDKSDLTGAGKKYTNLIGIVEEIIQ